MGPTALRLVLDPLAVIFLHNCLYIKLKTKKQIKLFFWSKIQDFPILETLSVISHYQETQRQGQGKMENLIILQN